jgi:hypothetical protein
LNDIGSFTTTGPVECIDFVAWNPTRPPGTTNIRLALRNSGTVATVSNVKATIIPLDSCIATVTIPTVSYENLAAGQELTPTGYFQVHYADGCPAGTEVYLAVELSSNERVFWRDTTQTIVRIATASSAHPAVFTLHQNYPNPFNPVSTIRYDLPHGSMVSLIIYDILGREIARAVDSYIEPGYHEVQWDGRDVKGREVPSGIYIAQLLTLEYSNSIKMVLLK